MINHINPSRRTFLAQCASTTAALSLAPLAFPQTTAPTTTPSVPQIKDPDIRRALHSAVHDNLLPAATQRQYPGHFTITSDGVAYGSDSTWPGLDSWQMAGAYLLLNQTQIVLDYFEFVRASQRADGNIPFAIFTGSTKPDTIWLRGLDPKDTFTYPSAQFHPLSGRPEGPPVPTKQWIGLFSHWQPIAQPISTLAPVSYLLTASEIFASTQSLPWLQARLPSLERCAQYLLTKKSPNGLISGSGFYTELPPRHGHDGVTQCYTTHAFRNLASLYSAAKQPDHATFWTRQADALSSRFVEVFWQQDHFAEYLHPTHNLIDSHGLSDTNFAAIAFHLATDQHLKLLWPLIQSADFWPANIPTQSVTKPLTYADFELPEPLPFDTGPKTKDAAALGRVWQLDALASLRTGDHARLLKSTRLVSRAAQNGHWSERYQLHHDGTVHPAGAANYNEYPAVLTRTILQNPTLFT